MTSADPPADRPAWWRRFGRSVRNGPFGRYFRGLDHVGSVVALVFLVVSLMPSLLPRLWYVQGLVSGISAACGYLLGFVVGFVVGRIARLFGWHGIRGVTRRHVWWAIGGLAIVVVPLMLWLGSRWQDHIRQLVHYPSSSRYLYGGVMLVALLSFALLLGIVRLVRDVFHVLTRLLSRKLPRRPALGLSAVLTALLVWGFVTGVVAKGVRAAMDATFSAADQGTYAGDVRPTSPLRSGGPGSGAPWDTLGLEGRAFVSRGPTAARIAAFTHRPAMTPIRVYAGRESAPSLEAEAQLVLAELERTHAFDRAVLAVATSTGTGWLNPAESDSLEYLYRGDTAIASMQYSFYPSWISFLVDRAKAQEAGRDLFDTIYDHWASLPADARPKLVVYGESLGAFGSNAAFPDVENLIRRTDAALFTGPPNSTAQWEHLIASRVPGSPERLPVIRGDGTVRFAASSANLLGAGGRLDRSRVIFLQHGSDPVVWWSPDLLFHKPAWLSEPRAPDVIPEMHWYPVVTFWQVTCDLIAATSPPAGYGHNYGPEVVTGWMSLLHPPGWTPSAIARLAALARTLA